MSMEFVGPYQIARLRADEHVARVVNSAALAASINSGLSQAEYAAKQVAFDALKLQEFDFNQALEVRASTLVNASNAEQSANEAAAVREDLEQIFLGGTEAVNDAAVATYVGTKGTATQGRLDAYLDERVAVADGVGEWWIHPLATYQESPYSRTLLGGISSTGEVLVSEFNHGTGRTRRAVIGQALVDDHNVPSVIAEPGRRVVASWTNHNNTGPAGESANSLHVRVGSRSGDIASLANAEPIQINILEQASYSQWHLIRGLSTADLSTYWVFVRMGTFSWQIATIEVNETTGALNLVRQRRLINTGSRQCYLSTADNYQEPQRIRVGFGFNPAAGDNQVCYLEIDPVSGEVSGADVAANVIANTGIPLAPEDIPPVADLTAETHSRRFFYTRPGPDGPAVAYAEWPKADPSAAQYYVREFSTSAADEYTGLILGSGYVQSEVMTAYQSQWEQGLEMEFWATLPDTLGVFGARIGTSSNPIALFHVEANGARRIRVRTDAGVIDNTSSGDWFSSLAGTRVGIRMRIDIAAGTCSQWINSAGTWDQIGSTGVNLTPGSTQILPVTDHRLIIQGTAKVVDSVKVSNLAGTKIVGINFTTDWPPYTPTRTHEGVDWSVENGAYIASNSVPPSVTTNLGASGPSIEPPGAAANARNYIAGAAFEAPSYDRAVITAASSGGTEAVTKHTPLRTGGWDSEVIRDQATVDGRLIRPYPPIGGGPVALTLTRMRHYAAFTDYEGDTVII